MGSSRLKSDPTTVFDVFLELALPASSNEPKILWKYPDDYFEEKILKHVVDFAFPCRLTNEPVQLFSFVLTNVDGIYTFGYCRYAPKSNTCLCFLSALPWSEFFYKFLNQLASLANSPEAICTADRKNEDVDLLLTAAYHQEIPNPGELFVVELSSGKCRLECTCPDDSKLPRIPDNRHLTEYYNAVDEQNMTAVWVSMLCERRIVMVSKKLGRLTSCILAANSLIYPMHWQHIFIPVLPERLFDYLQAPMPYLIGVPSHYYHKALKKIDLNEIVVLNIDDRTFHSPYNDLALLPSEVSSVLKKNLRNSNHLLGDGVARSFLRALVVLIGGYREALQFRPGESILFSLDSFLLSRPAHLRPFLTKMLELQIFRQFIESKLDNLNSGFDVCLKDEFEQECSLYSGKEYGKFRSQYNEWFGNMKKESGAFMKQLKTKVKSKGKEAMRDFKVMLTELKDEPGPSNRFGSVQKLASLSKEPSPIAAQKISHKNSTGSLNNNKQLVQLLDDNSIKSTESIDKISHKSDSSIERRPVYNKSSNQSPLAPKYSSQAYFKRANHSSSDRLSDNLVTVSQFENDRQPSPSLIDELRSVFAQKTDFLTRLEESESLQQKRKISNDQLIDNTGENALDFTEKSTVRGTKSVESLSSLNNYNHVQFRPRNQSIIIDQDINGVVNNRNKLSNRHHADLERLLIDFGGVTSSIQPDDCFDPLAPKLTVVNQTGNSLNSLQQDNSAKKTTQKVKRWETFE